MFLKRKNMNKKEINVSIEEEMVEQIEQDSELIEEVELAPMQEIQNKNAELEELLKRKTAEFDNFRKRTIQEKSDLLEYGNARVFSLLVDILDDLRNADDYAKKYNDATAIKSGLEMIYQKADKLFTEQGVKLIEVNVGDEFDVNFHEALMTQPSNLPEGQITMVLQSGYLYKDKVIRYAKVATSSGTD